MEKTNYSLVKISAGLIFTMFMMLCVLSCDKIDNPIRYGGGSKNPTVQQAVATVINVTGANPSDVTAALDAIVTNEAVAAAAAKGEPIKVTVAGSGVSTDATDKTITIPQKSGANIEISFATAPTTGTNALVLEPSVGAGTLPGNSNNNLTVTMPPSSGLAITIELPTTTVTLKTDGSGNVVYKDVIAKTAKQTIIIDKGVTIKEHELVGGNIIVRNGGEIETLAVTIKDNDGMVCLGSWWSGVAFKEDGPEPRYDILTEDGDFYIPKKIKVKKGAGNHITTWTVVPRDETIESLSVGKGVNVSILNAPQYKVIKGEGNNELLVQGGIGNLGGIEQYSYAFASNTDLVSNFAIKSEIDEDREQPVRPYNEVANLIVNYNAVEDNGSKTFTFENCAFDSNIQFALGAAQTVHYQRYVGFVNPEDGDPMNSRNLPDLLDAGIPNNIVERGQKSGGYWIDDEYEEEGPTCSNFTCILKFNNCTIGGNNITAENLKFPKWGIWGMHDDNENKNIYNLHFKVIIGDKTYNVVLNDQIPWDDPNWGYPILVEPE